ncbi:MAG: acyltransferase family protein [Eubacterium sp.]|nr:acyltransferase family protein [Eubacterium sp.]
MGKRIALWDNLKLFLIFLVVLGHIAFDYSASSQMFRTMTTVIYTFHMPAFVFISGLFCKRKVKSDSPPIKRAFSFVMLYLFARVLYFIPNIIFGVHSFFDVFSSKDEPWYMMAMAIWYMIAWAVRKIDSKYVFITSLVFACFVGYMKGNTDFLCIMRVITFFPFFYAGYVLDLDKVDKITSSKRAKIFSLIYFVAFVLVITVTIDSSWKLFPLLSGRRRFFALDDSIQNYGCLLRLGYYAVVGLLIFSIISLCPRKRFKITSAGSKTLQIYIYHRPILYIMENAGLFYLIRQIGEGWEWIAIIISFAITALLCFDFWQKPLDFIMNPKIKEENYAITK